MMLAVDGDRLLRVVYVIVRDGFLPPGRGVQKLPGGASSSEANRSIGDLISYFTDFVEEPSRNYGTYRNIRFT
jgi:hypothetical protein